MGGHWAAGTLGWGIPLIVCQGVVTPTTKSPNQQTTKPAIGAHDGIIRGA